MQDTEFRPSYSFRSLWDVLLISLGLLIGDLFLFWKLGLGLATSSNIIFSVLFCYWWMHSLIRRIVFSHSTFTVTSFLRPQKTIAYLEIIDISYSTIKTKRGNISLSGMENSRELRRLLADLLAEGKIDPEELKWELIDKEARYKKASLPSLIISLPLLALLFYFWPYHHYWFSPWSLGASSGLIFYVVNSIVQLISRKRLDEN